MTIKCRECDALGDQAGWVDARGHRTTFLYGADQHLTGGKYGDGTRATFVYESLGQRTRIDNQTSQYTTTYDELG
ncbi:MAG: hypothetical protein ACK5EA_29915, partial [Planctomycetaceae bacterium]